MLKAWRLSLIATRKSWANWKSMYFLTLVRELRSQRKHHPEIREPVQRVCLHGSEVQGPGNDRDISVQFCVLAGAHSSDPQAWVICENCSSQSPPAACTLMSITLHTCFLHSANTQWCFIQTLKLLELLTLQNSAQQPPATSVSATQLSPKFSDVLSSLCHPPVSHSLACAAWQKAGVT